MAPIAWRITHDDPGIEAKLMEFERRGWVVETWGLVDKWGRAFDPLTHEEIRVITTGRRIDVDKPADGVALRRLREEGKLVRVGNRAEHPDKRVEHELRDAEADGWKVIPFPHGPLWGEVHSPDKHEHM